MPRTRTQHIHTARQLYNFWHLRFKQAQINQVAASLAYTTILAIVPMLSIATILISQLSTFINLREAIAAWIGSTLIPGGLSVTIGRYLSSFSSHSKGLTYFGIAGLLVSVILMLMTIEKAFNQVWQVKQQRPILKRLLIYTLVTALGPVLLGISVYITSYFVAASREIDIGFTEHIKIIDWLVPFLLTMMPFIILYKVGPSAFVTWRDALIGGLLAAIVFETAKYGFTLFVTKAPVYKTLYGAFAIGPLFLVWIYLTWWVTMAGAIVTASLPQIRDNNWFTDV
jgi:membrane protein